MQQQELSRFAFPIPERLKTIPGVRPLELAVADALDIGPRMRRITLTGEALENFEYQPGQDVMLVLTGGERQLCRRYTIRACDPSRSAIELNIVAHGIHGPGAEWAATTRSGERINGVGPRGKIFIDQTADWHLFLGDESAAPGYLHMLEALQPEIPGQAYLEVSEPSDELSTSAADPREVNWLYRGDTPAIESTMLLDALTAAEFPDGRGHIYIAGEVQVVNAVLRAALARGFAADQLSPKAYWGRGKANENNGEPKERAEV